MQLSEKLTTFSAFFIAFLESALNLEHFEKMSFIAQVFPKLLTPKDAFTQMHERSCFRKPFGSERVNESLKVLKSAEKYLYLTFSSFWANLSQRKSFLVRSELLGLLVNTLTANYEYSRSNTDNLPLPLQRHLSEKLKIFSACFIAFLESALNLEHFEKKKWASWLNIFPSYWLPKTRLLKCMKGLVSENPLAVNVLIAWCQILKFCE